MDAIEAAEARVDRRQRFSVVGLFESGRRHVQFFDRRVVVGEVEEIVSPVVERDAFEDHIAQFTRFFQELSGASVDFGADPGLQWLRPGAAPRTRCE